MNKPVTEDELKERAVAPRITPELIESKIVSEHYFTARQGARASLLDDATDRGDPEKAISVTRLPTALNLLTICVLVLENGYTVLGQSACADPANYKRDIGERIARGDAVNKIWPLLGYQLRDQLFHDGVKA
jgi:hypothetical protein